MCRYHLPEMVAALVRDGADRRTTGQHDPRQDEPDDVGTVQRPSCAATPAERLRRAAPTAAATVIS